MANMGAGKGADYTGLVGRNSLTTQHQELFQSYVPGMPSGSMIVNPHVRVPGLKLARRLRPALGHRGFLGSDRDDTVVGFIVIPQSWV